MRSSSSASSPTPAKSPKHIGTDHHEVVIGMDEFFDALPNLVWHEDEPITWPSSVSLYFVSRLAAEQVKVVLTGEGSDELFAGYGRYRFYLLNKRWMRRIPARAPSALRDSVRVGIAGSSLLSGTSPPQAAAYRPGTRRGSRVTLSR